MDSYSSFAEMPKALIFARKSRGQSPCSDGTFAKNAIFQAASGHEHPHRFPLPLKSPACGFVFSTNIVPYLQGKCKSYFVSWKGTTKGKKRTHPHGCCFSKKHERALRRAERITPLRSVSPLCGDRTFRASRKAEPRASKKERTRMGAFFQKT